MEDEKNIENLIEENQNEIKLPEEMEKEFENGLGDDE